MLIKDEICLQKIAPNASRKRICHASDLLIAGSQILTVAVGVKIVKRKELLRNITPIEKFQFKKTRNTKQTTKRNVISKGEGICKKINRKFVKAVVITTKSITKQTKTNYTNMQKNIGTTIYTSD